MDRHNKQRKPSVTAPPIGITTPCYNSHVLTSSAFHFLFTEYYAHLTWSKNSSHVPVTHHHRRYHDLLLANVTMQCSEWDRNPTASQRWRIPPFTNVRRERGVDARYQAS